MPTYNVAIGSDCEGNNAADGRVRWFQMDNKVLSAAERTRLSERTTAPRMSEVGALFAQLTDDHDVYVRPKNDVAFTLGSENDYATQSEVQRVQPVRVAVYQEYDSIPDKPSHFFLDNVALMVSGIRWEFSADNGQTWFAIKDIMNESMSRFVFPKPTTTVNVRATGSAPSDWIQSYLIKPFYE